MAQYDPIVIKSGLAGVLGTDTLRADLNAHAGLTTTGLASGDVVQVTANLTLSKASNLLTSAVVGVYDGVSGSVVREGVVVATFKTAPTANGDAVYLSSTAGQLTTTKPTKDMLHEVGVVVDFANRKVLLQQKPVIALPVSVEGYLIVAGGLNWDGSNTKTETYTVSSGIWTTRADLSAGRYEHDMVALSDGRAMAIGGRVSSTVYNSTPIFSGTAWTSTGNMGRSRYRARAVRLLDGRVFVVGGQSSIGSDPITQSEIWDPSTGLWTDKATTLGRTRHFIAVLQDGKVLVGGGLYISGGVWYDTNTAVVYNPSNNTWTATANNLSQTRENASAVCLPDGTVLVAGGWNRSSCDLYNPATNSFTATGALPEGRFSFGMTVLLDGRVLLAGGRNNSSTAQSTAWLYSGGTWSSAGNMSQARTSNRDEAPLPVLLLDTGDVIVPANPSTTNNPQSAFHKYNISTGWSQPGNCGFNRQSSCGPGASVARY